MFPALKSISRNKKVLFLLIGTVLLLSFFPTDSVQADFKDCGIDLICWAAETVKWIFGLPINIALLLSLFLITIFFEILAGFLAAVFASVVALTYWLIDSSLGIGVIPGVAPEVVQIGWEFTLGFVNMLFILILAFYGLTTILRVKEYDVRKTLPRVIAIAILVNFTPVIVGLIVDGGNVATSFFVNEARRSDIVSIILDDVWGNVIKPGITTATDKIFSNLFGQFEQSIGYFIEAMGPLIISIIFLLFATIIYLLLAFVFLMRIVMLWVLMILAPIAFFSYIIPEKAPLVMLFPDILLWRRWWEEFLRWVVVGIPFGLFIYISNWMMAHSDTLLLTGDTYEFTYIFTFGAFRFNIGSLFSSVITIIPFAVPLFVLYTGYKIAMKAAPSAARGMISAVKSAGVIVASAGAGAVAGAAAGGAARVSGIAASRIEKFEGWAEGRRGGKLLAATAKPFGALTRRTERAALKAKARARAKEEEIPPEFKKMTAEEKMRFIKTEGSWKKREVMTASMKAGDRDAMIAKDTRFEKLVTSDRDRASKSKDYEKHAKKIKSPGVITAEAEIAMAVDQGKLEEEIKDKTGKISDKLGTEGVELEAALKYRIITAKDVDEDGKLKDTGKDKISEAKNKGKLTTAMKNKFVRDTAAAALSVEKMTPGDVAELSPSSLKSLAVRLGSHKWHSGHLNRVRDTFDDETIKDWFEGAGGINTMGIDKLEEKNSRLAQYLVTNPAGREWDYKGRKEMMEMGYKTEDNYGRIRPNYEKYKADKEKRGEVRGPSEIINEIAQYERDLKELKSEEKEFEQKGARLPREKNRKLRKIERALPGLEIELDKIREKEKKEAISSLLSDEEIQKEMFNVTKSRQKGAFDTYSGLQKIQKIPERDEREKTLKEGLLRDWDRKMTEDLLKQKYAKQIDNRSAGLTKERRKGQPGYGDAWKAVTEAGFKPDTKEAERFMSFRNQKDAIKELEEEAGGAERRPVKKLGIPETIIGEIARQEKQVKELEEELQKEALSFSEKRKAGEFDTNPELLEIRKEPDTKRRGENERKWDWEQAEEKLRKKYKTDTKTKIERIKKTVDFFKKALEETQQKEVRQALDILVSKEEVEEEALSFSEKRRAGSFDTNPELLEIRKEPDAKRRDELERGWDYRKAEEEMRKKHKEKIGERIIKLQEYSSKGGLGYGETWKAMVEERLDPRNEKESKKFIEIRSQTGAIKEFEDRKEKIDRLAKENYYKRLMGKEEGFKKEDIDTALSGAQIDPSNKPKAEDFLRKRDRSLAEVEHEKTQKEYQEERKKRAHSYFKEREESPEAARKFDQILERSGMRPLTEEAGKFGEALDWEKAGWDIRKEQETLLEIPTETKRRKGKDETINKQIEEEKEYFSTIKKAVPELKKIKQKIKEAEAELTSVEKSTPEDINSIKDRAQILFTRNNLAQPLEEKVVESKRKLEQIRKELGFQSKELRFQKRVEKKLPAAEKVERGKPKKPKRLGKIKRKLYK